MYRPLTLTGRVRRCLNLGSYNYLGFAASDEYCTPRVLDTMNSYGWAMCSSRLDAGTCSISSNCLPGCILVPSQLHFGAKSVALGTSPFLMQQA